LAAGVYLPARAGFDKQLDNPGGIFHQFLFPDSLIVSA
jgi:hypothetical protein